MTVSIGKLLLKLAALAAISSIAIPAFANPCPPGDPPTNCAPPAGNVIFDLAGQTLPTSYTQYSATFTAAASTTQLAFAFREDPAFWFLDNVSVTATGGGPNLVSDGNFNASPTLAGTAWNYDNTYGIVVATGFVTADCGTGGGNCWYDGSVQGYDGINQAISTVAGDTYRLTFDLNHDGPLTVGSQTSTNGDVSDTFGNGADVLAYAGVGVPVEGGGGGTTTGGGGTATAPEMNAGAAPTALSLLVGGLLVLRGRKLSRTRI